eukprot:TRINITY_DN107366_c0_g1_i1.p1 TRINITY_DN107366_c0_g1~~TRINITY_DN107366_c0_g1_i1.p1  ORF type:complete len:267 (+),score=33.21 TRINITY_DN107366_c0_g1_i1:247-1047(+)
MARVDLIRKLFKCLDKDNDGTLNREEIQPYLDSLGYDGRWPGSPLDLQRFMDLANDTSGKLCDGAYRTSGELAAMVERLTHQKEAWPNVTIRWMSGETCYGPEQVDPGLTMSQLENLVATEWPLTFVVGDCTLEPGDKLEALGMQVELTAVPSEQTYDELFVQLKQQFSSERHYNRHPSGRWVLAKDMIDEHDSDSSNPSKFEGSHYDCYDLACHEGDTFKVVYRRTFQTVYKRGGWGGDGNGYVHFASSKKPALITSDGQRVELG